MPTPGPVAYHVQSGFLTALVISTGSDHVVPSSVLFVTHTVREVADLNYGDLLETELPNDEILGELIGGKLRYYPTVTREPFRTQGRITDLIASGQLFRDLGNPPFDPAVDRVMLCGGPSVLADLKQQLIGLGYEEGSIASPGDFVLERAFVET